MAFESSREIGRTQMSEYGEEHSGWYDAFNASKDYQSEVQNLCSLHYTFNLKEKRVLDVGCGTGKHLKLFSDRGWDIEGVDISENMLKKATERLPEGTSLHLDINDASENHDFVISMFNVVNHLSPKTDDLDYFFSSIAKKMNTGGLLIFDLFNYDAMIKSPPVVLTRPITEPDPKNDVYEDSELKICPYFDEQSLTLDYIIDGWLRHSVDHTIWSFEQLFASLSKAGLGLLQCYELPSYQLVSKDNIKSYKYMCVANKIRRRKS